MSGRAGHVAVVGGGLAGIAAAVALCETGARVTMLEARPRLGGATTSFTRGGLVVDNGQHVFLRCCTAYRGLLARLGMTGAVSLQDRFDVTVLSPDGRAGLRRTGLPGPLHMATALARYRFLSPAARLRAAWAALAMARLDRAWPGLDDQRLGEWLSAHGQDERARRVLWDLFTVSSLNVPGDEANLALAATVVKTALLSSRDAADIGVPTVPLGDLHGRAAADLLGRLGASVMLGAKAAAVEALPTGGFRVQLAERARVGAGQGLEAEVIDADAVVLAVPAEAAARLLPPGAFPGSPAAGAGRGMGSTGAAGGTESTGRPGEADSARTARESDSTGAAWEADLTGAAKQAGRWSGAGIGRRVGAGGAPAQAAGDGGGPGWDAPAGKPAAWAGHDGPPQRGGGGLGPGPREWRELGSSPIVNVHVIYDRRVMRLPFAAAVDSPVQWVFDRTGPSGLRAGQYLAISLSAADGYVDVPAARLREVFLPALAELFPAARSAEVTDFFVTRERRATLRQVPGCEGLRPGAATALPGLVLAGAWTDTGWPDTMEGAVRSGLTAVRELRRVLTAPPGAPHRKTGDPSDRKTRDHFALSRLVVPQTRTNRA